MQVRESDEAHAVLHLSRNELILLNNALNEVCNGLDLPDFTTRLGAERSELRKLLRQIDAVLTGRVLDTDEG